MLKSNHFTHNHQVYGASCNYFERGKHTNSSHDSFNNPLYVPKFAKLLLLLVTIMRGENTLIAHILIVLLSNLFLLLVTIMREEERLIFMLLCYLKCNLLIITCIGYHKIAAIYSYIKCQCIGSGLDLNVFDICFRMLSFAFQLLYI